VEDRTALFAALHEKLRPLGSEMREAALDRLRVWLGHRSPRPDYRPLTWDEVKRMSDGGLIEVGAHTVSHPVLAALPVEMQRCEIEQSRHELGTHAGLNVTSFAYPYGGPGDFDETTLSLTRGAGIRLACTTIQGPATLLSRSLALPRMTVRNWSATELAARLDHLFAA
jgi:peptidoglycan/xylan/chitin deacetylase (PgdA/CDA1 family)